MLGDHFGLLAFRVRVVDVHRLTVARRGVLLTTLNDEPQAHKDPSGLIGGEVEQVHAGGGGKRLLYGEFRSVDDYAVDLYCARRNALQSVNDLVVVKG